MSIILETKRLILKTPELADLENLLALRTDPDVMRYIGNGSIQTREQVQEFLRLSEIYSKKHTLGFYCVFEKGTNNFIGQAGLVHLGFDKTQQDIELAYRLHKKFWHQGYATEFAKALISWVFNTLALEKIIAVVHPENERSRKVMEKSGMSYYGMINYRDSLLPCYEIHKNNTAYDKIKLVPASLEDYPIIQNLARFYVYDMGQYMGWEVPEDGLYECRDFKEYWEEKNAFPFLIKYENEIAGFVIVNKQGSDEKIEFNMAQFFILRKFKNKGIGRYVAQQCFKQFPGEWEVMVLPGNEGAYHFWRAIIGNYTNKNFVKYMREIKHFNNDRKNIFRFNSKRQLSE